MIIDRRKKQAISLAEVIVGLCLFAIVIIPIFGIIPMAYMSIKKAEDYSAASCYAQEVLSIYRLNDPFLEDDHYRREWDIVMNNTDYTVSLDVYAVDKGTIPHELIDVVVNMYWKKIPEQIKVFSRVYYNR